MKRLWVGASSAESGGRELTRGQRIGGVFLLVVFVIGSPLMVFLGPNSFAERVSHVGLVCSGFGVILDPQSFRLGYGTPLSIAAMPRVCRILLGVGGTLVGLGFIMRYLPTVTG